MNIRCRLTGHHFGPWHDHGPCVFSVDRHMIRCCARCPKIDSRFDPREDPMSDGRTPAWYVITYHFPTGTVASTVEIAPDFFWDDFEEHYRKDLLIILRGGSPQNAFPARQVLNVELRPARAIEIPKEATS